MFKRKKKLNKKLTKDNFTQLKVFLELKKPKKCKTNITL